MEKGKVKCEVKVHHQPYDEQLLNWSSNLMFTTGLIYLKRI